MLRRSVSTISKKSASCCRSYCESTPGLLELLRAQDVDIGRSHEAGAEIRPDRAARKPGVGVAFLPRSSKAPDTLLRLMVEKLELSRTVFLYGVAGGSAPPSPRP